MAKIIDLAAARQRLRRVDSNDHLRDVIDACETPRSLKDSAYRFARSFSPMRRPRYERFAFDWVLPTLTRTP